MLIFPHHSLHLPTQVTLPYPTGPLHTVLILYYSALQHSTLYYLTCPREQVTHSSLMPGTTPRGGTLELDTCCHSFGVGENNV